MLDYNDPTKALRMHVDEEDKGWTKCPPLEVGKMLSLSMRVVFTV